MEVCLLSELLKRASGCIYNLMCLRSAGDPTLKLLEIAN